MPGRRRHVIADQHSFADRGETTKARDDAIERERRDLGLGIFDQNKAGFGDADLGNGGRHRAREILPVGDRTLRNRTTGRDGVDQIGVDKQRRMLKHPARDLGLIGGKTVNDGRRCALAEGQRAGQFGAHQRGRVVQQHDERPFGRGTIIRGEIGIEEGARQVAGRISAL